MGRRRKLRKAKNSKKGGSNETVPQRYVKGWSTSCTRDKDPWPSLDMTVTYDYSCQTDGDPTGSMEELSEEFSLSSSDLLDPMCYSSPFPSLWTDVKSSPVKKSKNTSSKSIDNTPTLGRDFTDTSARFSQSNKEPACGSNYFDPTSTADDHENADMHSTSAGEEKLERLGCDSDGEDGLFWLQAAEILSQQESVDDNTIASLAFNSWDKEEELEATVIFQALVAGELT